MIFVGENLFCDKAFVYNFWVMVHYMLYTLLCLSKLCHLMISNGHLATTV